VIPGADPPDGPRSGVTYDDDRDRDRLNRQARMVWRVIRDGRWHTLAELAAATGGEPEASVSARLRDFRKARFGSHRIARRYIAHGLWEYRWEGRTTTDNDDPLGPCLTCFNDPPLGRRCPVCGRTATP
jgi:hypothetical protein